MTIKLQGVYGQQKATQTKNVVIGDVIIWNYGYKSEVLQIMPSKKGKTITFMLKSLEDGIVRPRKMGANRYVVLDKKENLQCLV